MPISPLAGKPAPAELLIDVGLLEQAYYENKPDFSDPSQRVAFGTSGHRGTPVNGTFNEAHILAITQAVCDYRRAHSIGGPIFVAKDTHALSGPAERTAVEVLAANSVEAVVAAGAGVTPVPVVSHAILAHNRAHPEQLADGLIATPSHNPPADGGFKYNPPNGGPADTSVTSWIQQRANSLLQSGNSHVCRVPFARAVQAPTTRRTDLIEPYVRDLGKAVDMEAIRSAGLKLGTDPLGGAALFCWDAINTMYGLHVEVVNRTVDPAFGFMTVDYDGQIRMDCSSPYAMAGLVKLKGSFQVAFGNDPDADRHGIVTPSAGLLNPNHYLAVAINYLLTHRPGWSRAAAVGKTVVSSSMIDCVVSRLDRRLYEVPVGFKWFAEGLFDGSLCFGGEESSGASFAQADGGTWTTDKDGLVMDLLAAEITARTGKDPGVHYQELTEAFGTSYYTRLDAAATPEQKTRLQNLTPDAVRDAEMAGEPITARLTRAPGNDAPIGGLKVSAASGWFAARPSGTEDVYKIYAESFQSEAHLTAILDEAQRIVAAALDGRP